MAKPKSHQQIAQLRGKAIDLHQRGDLRGAQAAYVKYLKHVPSDGEIMGYLAVTKFDQGYPTVALDIMHRACSLAPNEIGLRFNYARMLFMLQHYSEAELILRECISRDPSMDLAAITLGLVFLERGRVTEAIDHFSKAVQRWPEHADMYFNLAVAFRQDYQFENAERALERACALAPSDNECRLQLAKQLYHNRKLSAAIEQYSAILSRDPSHISARSGSMLAKLRICDWSDFHEDSEILLAALDPSNPVKDGGAPSPYLTTLISQDPADCMKAACIFSESVSKKVASRVWGEKKRPPEPPKETSDTDRIRLAYVSADFREHATAYLASELIELHDRTKFEVFGISYGPNDKSPMRQRMEAAFDHFLDVAHFSTSQIVDTMKQMRIDIAVDLQGFNQHNRMEIFARKPAPIQVIYLGWPGTSGSTFYDYIIADSIVIPRENIKHFSEQVIWLPGPYQPNDRNRKVATTAPSRSECGLPDGAFVFSCFNNAFKITPEIFDVWMRILHAVPGSVLWLLDSTEQGRENLRKEAVRRSVAPERIVFAPHAPNPDHLARHVHVDLMLDTLPYNAHTTASDALWMGIPVITCTGSSFAGRVATSLLNGCGLTELAAATMMDYEKTAIKLANDPTALQALKANLMTAIPDKALFNTPRLARHVDHAYLEINARHVRGEAPSLLDLTSTV